MSKKQDKRKKQDRAWAREAAKREAWFAKQANAPKHEQSREPMPSGFIVDADDMAGTLATVVAICTHAVDGKLRRDVPTMNVLIEGEDDTELLSLVIANLPEPGKARHDHIASLGAEFGRAYGEERIAAAFLSSECWLKTMTGEVMGEKVVTDGLRRDGFGVVAFQDITRDARGYIHLSEPYAPPFGFGSPILSAFFVGVRSVDRAA